MNKQALTEADIRSKFITPALVGVNGEKWNLHTQIREEVYFTRGVRGKAVKRGEASKADYILSYKPNLPLAIVEAKDNTHAVGAGMQHALKGQSDSRHRRRRCAPASSRYQREKFTTMNRTLRA